MTWPPYLALQYSWSMGHSSSNYNFILYAAIVVPMQGFWNTFVYARNRGLKLAAQSVRTSLTSLTSSKGSSFLRNLRISRSIERSGVKTKRRSNDNLSNAQASIVRNNSGVVKPGECADEEHPENYSRALTKLALAGQDLPEVDPF